MLHLPAIWNHLHIEDSCGFQWRDVDAVTLEFPLNLHKTSPEYFRHRIQPPKLSKFSILATYLCLRGDSFAVFLRNSRRLYPSIGSFYFLTWSLLGANNQVISIFPWWGHFPPNFEWLLAAISHREELFVACIIQKSELLITCYKRVLLDC